MAQIVTSQIRINAIAYLAILTMGFQQFIRRIGTTNIDISCVIFLICLIFFAAKIGFDQRLYILAMILNCQDCNLIDPLAHRVCRMLASLFS